MTGRNRRYKTPADIEVESSRVAMTPVRLVVMLIAVVGITSFATEKLSAAATKDDVESALSTSLLISVNTRY